MQFARVPIPCLWFRKLGQITSVKLLGEMLYHSNWTFLGNGGGGERRGGAVRHLPNDPSLHPC